jgi:hypothetical protein
MVTYIRFGAYAAVLLIAALFYVRHSTTAVTLSPGPDQYLEEGPALNEAVKQKAARIVEITMWYVTPQLGERYRLTLRKDGTLRRLKREWDFNRSPPTIRAEETSKATFGDFPVLAYAVAALPYSTRYVDERLNDQAIEFFDETGARRGFYFEKDPPEVWLLRQALERIEQKAGWKVLKSGDAHQ